MSSQVEKESVCVCARSCTLQCDPHRNRQQQNLYKTHDPNSHQRSHRLRSAQTLAAVTTHRPASSSVARPSIQDSNPRFSDVPVSVCVTVKVSRLFVRGGWSRSKHKVNRARMKTAQQTQTATKIRCQIAFIFLSFPPDEKSSWGFRQEFGTLGIQ